MLLEILLEILEIKQYTLKLIPSLTQTSRFNQFSVIPQYILKILINCIETFNWVNTHTLLGQKIQNFQSCKTLNLILILNFNNSWTCALSLPHLAICPSSLTTAFTSHLLAPVQSIPLSALYRLSSLSILSAEARSRPETSSIPSL